ncbi:S-adenosyl-L-methionine-dependent methyltransferase, partial [Catenaria anguillulae PL171]
DHKHVYDEIAPSYDWSIGWDELVMGLLLVRRWVISHAKGDTLELAAGTGRNTVYYPAPPKLTSLTLTDTSIPMLDQAVRTHLTKTSPDGQPLTLATTRRNIPTRVLPADAHALPLANAAFDTVISTFSLCSLHDPVRAVKEGIRVLKPGGSMWLVEHGRGKYAWLNSSLDRNAARHAEKWGCWHNRDIGKLVEEAVAQVGGDKEKVHIKRQYRLHFGTTWIIELVKEEA